MYEYYPYGELKSKTRRNFDEEKILIGEINAEYYQNGEMKSKIRKKFNADKALVGEINIIYEYYPNGDLKSKVWGRFDADKVFIRGRKTIYKYNDEGVLQTVTDIIKPMNNDIRGNSYFFQYNEEDNELSKLIVEMSSVNSDMAGNPASPVYDRRNRSYISENFYHPENSKITA